jgi:uroporphyrinogen decarboxylase
MSPEARSRAMLDTRSRGLYPVDLERFWADDRDSGGKPFSTAKPQVPLGIGMPAHCIFDELGVPAPEGADTELHSPHQVDKSLRRAYNDRAEAIIGRRLFPEDDPPPPASAFPPVKGLAEIFEAPVRHVGGSDWVMPAASTPAELAALLDRVERRDLASFLIPDNWQAECARIFNDYGRKPQLGGGIRGPVTAAMSYYGVENLIWLLLDQPELAARFRDVLTDAIIGMTKVYYAACGTPERRGFAFCDDECCFLNTELYAFFGQPILRRVFETFAPDPGDWRFQHSDSDMGHLMPLLHEVGLKGANFGPNIPAQDIRAAIPGAVIYGQLRPWTFARGTDDEVAAEVRRDIAAAGADGGLVIATSGSINAGSRLSGLRAVMSVIQHEGRYQPL